MRETERESVNQRKQGKKRKKSRKRNGIKSIRKEKKAESDQ